MLQQQKLFFLIDTNTFFIHTNALLYQCIIKFISSLALNKYF